MVFRQEGVSRCGREGYGHSGNRRQREGGWGEDEREEVEEGEGRVLACVLFKDRVTILLFAMQAIGVVFFFFYFFLSEKKG